MTAIEKRWRVVTIVCAVIIVVAIGLPHLLDRALWAGERILFTAPEGDRLNGTYYPGEIDAGVLLLEGFGSDQVTMRSIASAYARRGFHVMTFDFSGHGRSPGTLGYDNAETPRLAYQAIAAMEKFSTLSGLNAQRIIIIGHSLGARVALQSATMGIEPAGLVLLGTQVNFSTNTQAEFFTGISDVDLAWVQALDSDNPPTDILMISGAWDDILTPGAATLLIDRLGGISSSGDYQRDLVIFPVMLHNYEVFSTRAISKSLVWSFTTLNLDGKPDYATTAQVRRICWFVGFSGLLVTLMSAARWVPERQGECALLLTVTHVHRYLLMKLLYWLAALPIGLVIACAFFFSGIALPTFNLIYVAAIGGYGILLWSLYRFRHVPGTDGGLLYDQEDVPGDVGVATALGVTLIVWLVCVAYTRTGWIYMFPFNLRLVWLALFSGISSVGFWISAYEERMIKVAVPDKIAPRLLNTLIGFLPFFLYAGFLAALGSLSGVVGAVQGLLILWLTMSLGKLLNRVNKVTWVNALCQAVFLYSLILPQGVMFQ